MFGWEMIYIVYVYWNRGTAGRIYINITWILTLISSIKNKLILWLWLFMVALSGIMPRFLGRCMYYLLTWIHTNWRSILTVNSSSKIFYRNVILNLGERGLYKFRYVKLVRKETFSLICCCMGIENWLLRMIKITLRWLPKTRTIVHKSGQKSYSISLESINVYFILITGLSRIFTISHSLTITRYVFSFYYLKLLLWILL